MNSPLDSSKQTSSQSRFTGFSPIDEPPEFPRHDRVWRWGIRSALFFGCVGVAIGAVGESWSDTVVCGAMLGVIGLLLGLRWGYRADREAKESRIRDNCEQKHEEDVIWQQKLAAAQRRADETNQDSDGP